MGRLPAIPGACCNCGYIVSRLTRDRCEACYSYFRRYGCERPARLWNRGAVTWEEVQEGEDKEGEELCDCGRPTRWRVTVPISEKGRVTLLLCEGCAALERRLSPVSSWGE